MTAGTKQFRSNGTERYRARERLRDPLQRPHVQPSPFEMEPTDETDGMDDDIRRR